MDYQDPDIHVLHRWMSATETSTETPRVHHTSQNMITYMATKQSLKQTSHLWDNPQSSSLGMDMKEMKKYVKSLPTFALWA